MKNNRLLLATVLATICTALPAQTITEVLESIEEHNPTLRSASLERQAGEAENRAASLPAAPEFEFNYLWNSAETGARRDFRVTQTLDAATISGSRAALASSSDEMLAQEYRSVREKVLLEARMDCIDLIYYNALADELEYHLANASKLVSAYERKVELGGASVLELNNARLHHSTVRGELKKVELERTRIALDLCRLNGGEPLQCSESDFSSIEEYALPGDFQTFFDDVSEVSPELASVRSQMEIARRQVGIDRSAWIPDLTVGYMAEITAPEAFRGLTFGVSIPLWSNASKVRRSKLAYEAAKSRNDEMVQSLYYQLYNDYIEAQGLQSIAVDYRNALIQADNREYLMKAEEQGELSIIEYITEIDLYYGNLEQTLAAERDYHLAVSSLTAVFL